MSSSERDHGAVDCFPEGGAASPNPVPNRRRAPRYELQLPLFIKAGQHPTQPGLSLNVSASGMLARVPREYRIHTPVELLLVLGESLHDRHLIRGKVVRTLKYKKGRGSSWEHQIALQFSRQIAELNAVLEGDLCGQWTPTRCTRPPSLVFRRRDGTTVGPLDLPAAIDQVMSGHFGPEDSVALSGEAFCLIEQVGFFRSLLPEGLPRPDTDLTRLVASEKLNLSEIDLRKTLCELSDRRETGLVVVEWNVSCKHIYFSLGHPCWFGSPRTESALGRFLVEKHVISEQESQLAHSHVASFNYSLAEALVGLGVLDSVTLFHQTLVFAKTELCDILKMKAGEYRFYRTDCCPIDAFPFVVTIEQLLEELLAERRLIGR